MDHRLVAMLLVSGVRLPGGQEAIANFPYSQRWVCYPDGFPARGTMPVRYEVRALGEDISDCPAHEREFVAFLNVLNGLRRIYAVSYRPFIPIGAPFRPDVTRSLHDLLAFDPAKQAIRPVSGGRLQLGLLAPEDKIVLCEEEAAIPGGGRAGPATTGATTTGDAATPAQICSATNASVVNTDTGQGAVATNVPDFTLRSTLGIFAFLGQVLGSQENRSKPGNDVCVRLDPQEANEHPSCDKGQVLFHLTHDRTTARFGAEYDGQYWGVPNAAPCINSRGYCDHTLETLSMLSLLLNLNKAARDIPSTPAVQLVP